VVEKIVLRGGTIPGVGKKQSSSEEPGSKGSDTGPDSGSEPK
jgi:hypothetical protein